MKELVFTYLFMLLGTAGMIFLIHWLTLYRLLMTMVFIAGAAFSAATCFFACWPAFAYIWRTGDDTSLFPPAVPSHWLWIALLTGFVAWSVFFAGALILKDAGDHIRNRPA